MRNNVILAWWAHALAKASTQITISSALIWPPQTPREHTGAKERVPECLRARQGHYCFLCSEESETQRSVVSDSDNWHLSDATKRKLLAKPSNLKLLTNYYLLKARVLTGVCSLAQLRAPASGGPGASFLHVCFPFPLRNGSISPSDPLLPKKDQKAAF